MQMGEQGQVNTKKAIINYACTCGKAYHRNSSLSNHVKQKHDNNKGFMIKLRERGRPPKPSQSQRELTEGFVPQRDELQNLLQLLMFSLVNSRNVEIKKAEHNLSELKLQLQESQGKANMDEIKNWIDMSTSLLVREFSFILNDYPNSIFKEIVLASYKLSLIRNRDQKSEIVKYFGSQITFLTTS